MKAAEYRRQVELQLEQQQEIALESGGRPTSAPLSTAAQALDILEADGSAADQRAIALQMLKAASFDVAQFADHAAAFHAVLQRIAVDGDADTDLRRDALEILVSEHDEVARQVLASAITAPETGAVSVPVALSLLARDDHGAAVALARAVLENSDVAAARAQAVRIMGTVSNAAEELGALLRDKQEVREVRKASAVALRALSPTAFDAEARQILDDSEDFPEIRATLQGVLNRTRDVE